MALVDGGDVRSPLETDRPRVRIERLRVAVLHVWLHLAFIGSSTPKLMSRCHFSEVTKGGSTLPSDQKCVHAPVVFEFKIGVLDGLKTEV